jgi:hypothetical protein
MLCAMLFALLQSRAALMHKLAANAGLDVSNVPQIPLPQVMQPQVRRGGYGLKGWPPRQDWPHSCKMCCQRLVQRVLLALLVVCCVASTTHERPL